MTYSKYLLAPILVLPLFIPFTQNQTAKFKVHVCKCQQHTQLKLGKMLILHVNQVSSQVRGHPTKILAPYAENM